MNLPSQSILEFIEIYRQEFGVNLPYAEAEEKARSFVSLFVSVSKSLNK